MLCPLSYRTLLASLPRAGTLYRPDTEIVIMTASLPSRGFQINAASLG